MGNLGSREASKENGEVPSDDPFVAVDPPPSLTEEHKDLLLKTWSVVEEEVAKVGVIMFTKFFETHPDVQDTFLSFKGIELEKIKNSKQLKAHALRVMGLVQKAIVRVNDQEKLQNLLMQNGASHYHYGAEPKFIDLMGTQFMYAIKPSLEDCWSKEVEAAWIMFFKYIAYYMKLGIMKESQRPTNSSVATKQEE